jgi:FimV-like protein
MATATRHIPLLLALLVVASTGSFAQTGRAGAQNAQVQLSHGPVKAHETLWSIASQYAEGDVTDVSRMSVTIFRANPGAFYDNNINRLKQGVMLSIPAASALQAVEGGEAVRVLQQHESSYRDFYREFTMKPAEKGALQLAADVVEPSQAVVTESASGELSGSSVSIPLAVSAAGQVDITESVEAESGQSPGQVAPLTAVAATSGHDDHEEIVTRLTYDVSAMYDDNIRRSRYPDDIRDDYLVNLTLDGRLLFAIGEFSNMTLGASLALERFSTFDQLDSVTVEASAKYAFAFSSAFTAMNYALKLEFGSQDFESQMRDADFVGVGFEASTQVTDRLFLVGGVKSSQRESRSRVFDTRENQFFINADLSLSRRNVAYLTYSLIKGDLVSTATPRLVFINAAEVIEADDAFGGQAFDQFAYRLDATTHVVTLGFNRAIKRGLTFDVSWRFVTSEADEESRIEYDRNIVRGGLIGRF